MNLIFKSISGITLAMGFMSSATASTVEYTWNYSDPGFSVNANLFYDDVAKSLISATFNLNAAIYNLNSSTTYTADISHSYLTFGIGGSSWEFVLNSDQPDYKQLVVQNFDVNTGSGYLGLSNGASTLASSYLIVQDLTKAQVSAVPEPEAYAILLAGLGLVGFTARRHQKTVA